MSENVPAPPTRRRALDPELAALQVLIPEVDIADVALAREIEQDITREMRRGGHLTDVETEDVSVTRDDGSRLGLRIYRPRRRSRRRAPALVFFHGGSFVTGGLDTEDVRCASYAVDAECVVLSVDYRLAPEDPYPAGFEDCCSALGWAVAQAAELGLDRRRIAIGGLSAGGALAAGVAAFARDVGGVDLVLQMLLFPVLDAGLRTPSAVTFTDTPILSSGGVRTMWDLYLGPGPNGSRDGVDVPVPAYASPAHLEDLRGLPPTFLCTAEFDPLRDEALTFVPRLLAADVAVDFRLYARAFHSFDSFRATRLATSARRDQVEALRAAFA